MHRRSGGDDMNRPPRPRSFVVGLFLVAIASYFASWTLENGAISVWPTAWFVLGFVFVLGGQAWFIGEFMEQPEGGLFALLAIAWYGVVPGLVVLSQTWGTEYDVMKWAGVVDISLVLGIVLLTLVSPLLVRFVPEKWKLPG
jgi:hypothetical protein